MIFTSKKKKTAKVIQRATKDVVSDRNLATICGNMTSNENAASYLCTEVMLQRIHALVFVFNRKFHREYDWATLNFVTTCIEQGIQEGTGNQTLNPIIMKGLSRLMSMEGSGPERMNKLFNSSAQLVIEQDKQLNQDELINFIDKDVESFVMGLDKYFQ
ncbi:hypothetical protein [Flavobacterium chungnamense]|uniref:Uncharacterized protein n=1 Tax=Flavobacterium chungnamense TaxID=706182 RepID=A0ABP7UTE1_9FLAO